MTLSTSGSETYDLEDGRRADGSVSSGTPQLEAPGQSFDGQRHVACHSGSAAHCYSGDAQRYAAAAFGGQWAPRGHPHKVAHGGSSAPGRSQPNAQHAESLLRSVWAATATASCGHGTQSAHHLPNSSTSSSAAQQPGWLDALRDHPLVKQLGPPGLSVVQQLLALHSRVKVLHQVAQYSNDPLTQAEFARQVSVLHAYTAAVRSYLKCQVSWGRGGRGLGFLTKSTAAKH